MPDAVKKKELRGVLTAAHGRIVFQADHSRGIRTEQRQGRSFTVVPIVALREMVLHCSGCHPAGELISAKEIGRSVRSWNGRPVTLDHPRDSDGFLTLANDSPEFFDAQTVGQIWNTNFDGDRLLMELWLDTEALRKKSDGPAVLSALNDDKSFLEVSTGYLRDRIDQEGTHRNDSFAARQENLVPDHVAILIESEGACSVADGCGGPREVAAQKQGGTVESDGEKKGMFAALQSAIVGALNAGVIVGRMGTKVEKPPSQASVSGKANPTGGKAASSDPAKKEQPVMDRKELLKALADNKKVSFSEKVLTAMSDEELSSLAELAGIDCKCLGTNEGKEKKPAGNQTNQADPAKKADGDGVAANASAGEKKKESAGDSASGNVVLTQEDMAALRELAKAAPALVAAGTSLLNEQATSKEGLVARLNGNAEVKLTKEQLQAMDIPILEALEASFGGRMPDFDYSGQGATTGSGDGPPAFMPIPEVFGKKLDKKPAGNKAEVN